MARILIAEDEDSLRHLVARALSLDGHRVMTASDGAEALDLLAREHGAFELLLTDIRMPVMDGIALALAAARDHPQVAILLMTGYADQRERAHGLDALIHDVIAKPFSLITIRTPSHDALAPLAAAPRRRGGMDHVLAGQTVAARDLGSAGCAAVERAALGEQFRPRRAVDGAIDAAAAQQRGVGGIDDGIDRKRGDVGDA